jgi:hypothetical protein
MFAKLNKKKVEEKEEKSYSLTTFVLKIQHLKSTQIFRRTSMQKKSERERKKTKKITHKNVLSKCVYVCTRIEQKPTIKSFKLNAHRKKNQYRSSEYALFFSIFFENRQRMYVLIIFFKKHIRKKSNIINYKHFQKKIYIFICFKCIYLTACASRAHRETSLLCVCSIYAHILKESVIMKKN